MSGRRCEALRELDHEQMQAAAELIGTHVQRCSPAWAGVLRACGGGGASFEGPPCVAIERGSGSRARSLPNNRPRVSGLGSTFVDLWRTANQPAEGDAGVKTQVGLCRHLSRPARHEHTQAAKRFRASTDVFKLLRNAAPPSVEARGLDILERRGKGQDNRVSRQGDGRWETRPESRLKC